MMSLLLVVHSLCVLVLALLGSVLVLGRVLLVFVDVPLVDVD
jgi:hypothetical protein